MSLRILLLLLFAFQLGKAQTTDSTYAERLGFPKGAKVLILHVDDAGMSYDSNEGAVAALTKGVATSCSVMMPCPWVSAFVRFLKEHPSIDAGLHLTLTSEWKDYRWGPLAGKPAVPGLVDTAGDFWASVEEVAAHASAEEVDKEMRAQLQRAEHMGFQPTHLDTHMGTVYATPAFLERYVRLGIEKKNSGDVARRSRHADPGANPFFRRTDSANSQHRETVVECRAARAGRFAQ